MCGLVWNGLQDIPGRAKALLERSARANSFMQTF
jgi:hypothetical protein